TAPTATATHTYAAGGTYTVTLIATDTGGKQSAPATASVTVTASSGLAYIGRVASATVSSSSTSVTLTAGRQVAAGDAILVAVLLGSTSLTGSVGVTDGAGNLYTLDRDQNDGSANDRTLVFSSKNVHALAAGGTLRVTY